MRLAAVFALLVGVNVYVFFFSSGSLKKVSQAAQAASTHAPGVDSPSTPPSPTPTPTPTPTPSPSPSPSPNASSSPSPALPPAASHPAAAAVAAAPKSATATGTVRDRDALGTILRREGISPSDTDAVIRALRPVMDFKREIHPGEKYLVRYDDQGHLASFELLGTGAKYVVARDASGKLDGKKVTR
jgi:hypothetical protein